MILNGYLLLPEHEMQIEKVVVRHQDDGVNEAFLVKEGFHVEVLGVLSGDVVELDLVEVPFGVVELVEILPDVQIFEVVLYVVFGELEGLVIDNREHIILRDGGIDHALPKLPVDVVLEHEVVEHIMASWVVEHLALVE